ncbi:MAG: hypothetical protein A2289_27120 [Deltaproteobacteria bacterium RIFOXYA12_FULL_58_15]|nr:MAG: hypothetical protein A2289_27120 [Deltaproteobacteria bacterium RIFOXYA12_FULL_58_15]
MTHRLVVALGLTFAISLLFVPRGRAQSSRPKLAIMPLQAVRGVDPSAVELLTEVLTVKVANLKRHDVLSVSEVEALLGFERMRDAMGCDELTCAMEIGGALGSEQMLTGSIGRLGSMLSVTMTLYDVPNSRVLKRTHVSVENEEDKYEGAVVLAVEDLFGSANVARDGHRSDGAEGAEGAEGAGGAGGAGGLLALGGLSGADGSNRGVGSGEVDSGDENKEETSVIFGLVSRDAGGFGIAATEPADLEQRREEQRSKRLWGQITFFTGSALVVAAGVSAAMSSTAASDYRESWSGDDSDRSKSWAAVMYATGGAGALAMGLGLWWWMSAEPLEGNAGVTESDGEVKSSATIAPVADGWGLVWQGSWP